MLRILFVTVLAASIANGDISCELKTSKGTGDYNLNSEASSGINYDSGQSSASLSALECTCTTDSETFGDSETTALNDNSNIPDDWKNASILWLGNCDTLIISSLPKGSTNGFQGMMEGAALILENINDLQLSALDLTASNSNDNPDSGVFTSVVFRNVAFSRMPSSLTIQDKHEALFDNVTAITSGSTTPALNLIVRNLRDDRDPVVRIWNSNFGGSSATDNKFKIQMDNDMVDSDNCLTGKGKLEIMNSTFGSIPKGNLDVRTGNDVTFTWNFVDFANDESFVLENIKNIDIANNKFLSVANQPLLSTTYDKKVSSQCTVRSDEFQESDFSAVKFESNHLSGLQNSDPVVSFNLATGGGASDWSSNFVTGKFAGANNTVLKPCDCDDVTYADSSNPTDDEKAHSTLVSGSKCVSSHNFETGLRSDICAGNHPQTPEEWRQSIEDDVKGDWVIYLIIGILAAALVSAVVTGLIIKCCCMESSEVDDRDRRR